MVIKSFEYYSPTTLDEACSLLQRHGETAKILAGGQSLIPLMKLNLVEIQHVIDIKRIPNLSSISIRNTGTSAGKGEPSSFLDIGALATHSQIEKSELIRTTVPLLADTAFGIGHPLVRNRGTIGGSVCHCDPAADYCPTLLVLGAEMNVVSRGGSERTIPSSEFIRGTFETSLESGEILQKVSVPIPKGKVGYSIKKLTAGHGDFPLVTVSVLIRMDETSRSLEHVAIALGGVGEKAFRVPDAEEYLLKQGKNLSPQHFGEAGKLAMARSKPEPDLDVSADYKKKMVAVLTRRSLQEAFERVQDAIR